MSGTNDILRPEHARGRGAAVNPAGRFEPYETHPVDDGWPEGEAPPPRRTEVALERLRRVITRNTSPDVPFDRSINPYRGCEHGCIYCFARPSHAYLGMSPGLDFETRLVAKPDAPARLAEELARNSYSPAVIALGTNTDPYQPIEGRLKIMRGILDVLAEHDHPVGIVTKGTLIERDIDILAKMAERGLAHVGISVTTLDPDIARKMEPRVPHPARRLQTIRRLAEAGIPVRVMASPMIPGLTDAELDAILEAGRDAGATAASYIALRLPGEVAGLFRAWLEHAFPDRAARVMARVREMHGGRDYDPAWGKRMTGEGLHAQLLARRFDLALNRLGLSRHLPPLRIDLFRIPPRAGDQLALF